MLAQHSRYITAITGQHAKTLPYGYAVTSLLRQSISRHMPRTVDNSCKYCNWSTANYKEPSCRETARRSAWLEHFYRASSYANAVKISCQNFVRLSVTRVLCDKTKQCTADILIPHERAITLVFWYQQWLVGEAPFRLKFALKVTRPLRKTPTSTDFRL